MGVKLPRLPFEGPTPKLGEGVSRASPKDAIRQYRLKVERPKQNPMLITIRAPSQRKAVTYCRNRWPDSIVTPIKCR